ncbi:MAG TPA: DMT family transporter [Devosia sp.]|jgi:drug/metabolite transporter (DMT)-like permease|nr:DMT family transporter [Devosia sp.]
MSDVASGARRDNVGRGIALTLFAILIFSTQDASSKFLVEGHSPFQITMMRFWGFGAFSLLLVLRQGPLRHAFRSSAPWLQVSRGVLLVADIWLFAIALRTVGLPELQAITLVYPLLVTLVAIPVLGERVGLFRFAAVGVGFLGALVIVRPGGLPLDWGVAAGISSAACYAIYIVLTRKVSAADSTTTSMFYVGAVGLVLTSAVGVFYWSPLDTVSWLLVIYIMITSCVAHGIMMVALSIAPASVLQPFNYTSLPWSILFSYFVFQHLIDPTSLLGAAVIVGAGLVVMMRERIRRVPAAAAEPALPGKE